LIAQYLDLENTNLSQHDDLKHYQGLYVSKKDSIKIFSKNNILYLNYNNYTETIIIPFDSHRFIASRVYFCTLKFNDQGEVIGISEHIGDRVWEYKKKE